MPRKRVINLFFVPFFALNYRTFRALFRPFDVSLAIRSLKSANPTACVRDQGAPHHDRNGTELCGGSENHRCRE
jgi:hypothetical protein